MRTTLVSCCYEKGNFSYPLGALCIQEALGGDVKLENHFLSEDPRRAARQTKGDAIGISVYLWNRAWFDQFVQELTQIHPNVVLFAGGPEVTANPKSFDLRVYSFLSLGEGEESVPKALEMVGRGAAPAGIQGIVTRGGNLTYACPEDVETLGSVILDHKADPFLASSGSVLWELTRGCPFHCAFCFESKGVRSVRHFPMERIERELDYLLAHHVRDIFVLDPTFNMDKERTKELLQLFIRKAKKVHFTFENRAELLDEELIRLFSQLDCALQIGMQSSNPKALAAIDRRMQVDKFQKNVHLLSNSGITFGLDLIIGLPGDTLEGFSKSLDDAISFQPSNIDIFLLSLLPGTRLGDEASEKEMRWDHASPYLLIESRSMDKEAIRKALLMKQGCDLFYTKGQAWAWMGLFCKISGVAAHQLLHDFALFAKGRETEEIYELQDQFVRQVLKQTGKRAYSKLLTSYMELYQGIAYLLETGDTPVVELFWEPNELSQLEELDPDQFLRRYPSKHQMLAIIQEEDGSLFFEPQV
ncbi:MAG: radical SAM protein [Sphaerochaetaceae bacterium]|nr:radical SAM protein [Spirochaetales bacterium]MDY5499122.1 radical SAM protein [Sphaerochaetaceae bacterium]